MNPCTLTAQGKRHKTAALQNASAVGACLSETSAGFGVHRSCAALDPLGVAETHGRGDSRSQARNQRAAALLFGAMVLLVHGSCAADLDPPPPRPASQGPPVVAAVGPARSNADTVLDLYAELTGLTVLGPAAFPELPVALISAITQNTNQAVSLIEGELRNGNFEILRKANLFAVVVPVGFTNRAAGKRLENIAAPIAEAGYRIPAGAVNLTGADINQVLAIYGELVNRTILCQAILAAPPLRFRTQKALSKDQVVYGFKLLLALNGIAVIEDGRNFLEVVPVDQVTQFQPHAPKPAEGERLIDPTRVPKFGWTPGPPRPPAPPPTPQTQLSNELAQIYVDGRTKLGLGSAAPPKPTAGDLAAFYARVCDLTFMPSNRFDHFPVMFTVRTPVTRAELLYGIETTFELNNLVLVPVDKKSIRVGHISERKPAER
jgi:hypothetical protein